MVLIDKKNSQNKRHVASDGVTNMHKTKQLKMIAGDLKDVCQVVLNCIQDIKEYVVFLHVYTT